LRNAAKMVVGAAQQGVFADVVQQHFVRAGEEKLSHY